jgi:hypothetical protein
VGREIRPGNRLCNLENETIFKKIAEERATFEKRYPGVISKEPSAVIMSYAGVREGVTVPRQTTDFLSRAP